MAGLVERSSKMSIQRSGKAIFSSVSLDVIIQSYIIQCYCIIQNGVVQQR